MFSEVARIIVIDVSDLFFSDFWSLCVFRGLCVLSSLTSLIYFSLISRPCVFSEMARVVFIAVSDLSFLYVFRGSSCYLHCRL